MNINLEYYRVYFYYVAKYQNFTRAARRWEMDNITRAINLLEQEIRCAVYPDQSGRG